jgi:hypothetical protein
MDPTIQIDRWVSEETTVDATIGPAYFNSAFSFQGSGPSQNAKLTIYLRVWLEPLTTTWNTVYSRGATVWDYWTSTWVPLQGWPAGVFPAFKNWFKMEADSFWGNHDTLWGNSGMVLMPLTARAGLDWPLGTRPTHRLNVDCDFEIVWANGPGDAHVVYYCAYLVPNPVNPVPTGPRICVFTWPGRSTNAYPGLLTYECAFPTTATNLMLPSGPKVPPLTGYVIPHEVGHAIGLPHIGVAQGRRSCLRSLSTPGAINASNIGPCATGETVDDINNIMGYGHGVTFVNAVPWLLRVTRHTHTNANDWMRGLGYHPPRSLTP